MGSPACPPATLKTGEVYHGFFLKRILPIEETCVTFYELTHLSTGAQVIHLHCGDDENLFSIGFRTPPYDSTGLPHILEHCVLAGSTNYPVKDAFNELLRGSLQTFINAFTYPDKTIYPVASRVQRDFFNLVRVYMDLVLRPLLREETFRQEGHHLEVATAPSGERELIVSGIVFNEMKGSYSSPDSLMFKAIQEHIFPDTIYRHDSGGDPEKILSLTYEQLRNFHRVYYSPSNARILIYGDIETAQHLAFLEEILQGFGRVDVDSVVPPQTRWQDPRRVRRPFPIDREEDPAGKAVVNCAWMLGENTEEELALLHEIVAGYLVGSAAGPIRKTLIDSGLGQDLSPATGMERDYRQPLFIVGLRGTDPDKAEQIEALVMNTMADITAGDLDKELIEATLHQVEFGGREIVRRQYPYGIVLMGRVYQTWLYGGDPVSGLNFPRMIDRIRQRWQDDRRLFNRIIKDWLVDNPHRLLVIMEPDAAYLERRERTLKESVHRRRASMTEADMERVAEEAAALAAYQKERDAPETLGVLPRLRVGDIDRKIDIIPTDREICEGVEILTHELFTNGIAYVDVAFDLGPLPDEEHLRLPLLGKLMLNMGAAGLSYEETAKRIALKTGGVSYSLASGMRMGGGVWQKMIFRVKTLYRHLPEALTLLADLLCAGDLANGKRAWDLIKEKRNALRAAVVPSGHVFAGVIAADGLTIPAHRNEQWHGRRQLKFLHAVAEKVFPTEAAALLGQFETLRGLVVHRQGVTINLTAHGDGLKIGKELLGERFLGRLPSRGGDGAQCQPELPVGRDWGIIIPAEVSFVAEALPAPPLGDHLVPPLTVASRLLANGFLYKTIRVQGGAYGGMCQYDPMTGVFLFLSYRDPHIERTIRAYNEAAESICRGEITDEDVEKAVIGTIGAIDRPSDPAGKGMTAMIRRFAGITDEWRRSFREEILGMDREKIIAATRIFFGAEGKRGRLAVLSAEERLRQANENLGGRLTLIPLTD